MTEIQNGDLVRIDKKSTGNSKYWTNVKLIWKSNIRLYEVEIEDEQVLT